MSTKIMIVDDHGMVREGLHLLLEKQDDMEVVAEASDGRQAVELAEKFKPDIVLMDVTMPNLNGIDATKRIINENAQAKVLALSAHCNRGFVTDMLKAGVRGYILKDGMADELIRAIRAVEDGEQYLSPKVAKIVVAQYMSKCKLQPASPTPGVLTSKERELIQLLAENKSNKEAARLLHVSVKTVDARRRTIMEKLGVDGIAGLTKYAVRAGLTTIDA